MSKTKPPEKKRSLRKPGLDKFFADWETDEGVKNTASEMREGVRLANEQRDSLPEHLQKMNEHTSADFAEWGKAIERYLQRKEAFASWNVAREHELQQNEQTAPDAFGSVMKKYDGLFAEILKQYPIETIHDFTAITNSVSTKAHNTFTKMDQSLRGRQEKPDALQELILGMVRKNLTLSKKELLAELEKEKNKGVIEDIDGETISFGRKDEALDDAPISGLKDRLSRAKKAIKKEK